MEQEIYDLCKVCGVFSHLKQLCKVCQTFCYWSYLSRFSFEFVPQIFWHFLRLFGGSCFTSEYHSGSARRRHRRRVAAGAAVAICSAVSVVVVGPTQALVTDLVWCGPVFVTAET